MNKFNSISFALRGTQQVNEHHLYIDIKPARLLLFAIFNAEINVPWGEKKAI